MHVFTLFALLLGLTAHAQQPNVVIIYADDMGYGDLSAQNQQSKIPTPHLDQLAAQGVRFTDGHSSSGICTPSRYALLTGRYHWRDFHGIVTSFGKSKFKAETQTMPEAFQSAGYHTACIGKWHLGWDWPITVEKPSLSFKNKAFYGVEDIDWEKPILDGPLAHGFDHYFGDDAPNFPPYSWIENDRVTVVPTTILTEEPAVPEGGAETRPGPAVPGWSLFDGLPTLQNHTTNWLREASTKKQPFFLYLALPSPHAPIVPTPKFSKTSEAGPYGDFVVQTDAFVGQVTAMLDRLDLTKDTIVVFTSDNGPEGYAHRRLQKTTHDSSGGLRGVKRDLWEGGHRVPFLLRWPSKIAPNQVSSALISQIDLMRTLANLAQVSLEKAAAPDSIDFSPYLLSQKTEKTPPRNILVHNTRKHRYGLRKGPWLYLNTPTGSGRPVPDFVKTPPANTTPDALYHLGDDLAQTTNLVTTRPEIATDLRAQLQEELSSRQVQLPK